MLSPSGRVWTESEPELVETTARTRWTGPTRPRPRYTIRGDSEVGSQILRKMTVPLVPPKPKELESATSSRACRA